MKTMETIEITLGEKLNQYQQELINKIIVKNCNNVEFIRGQINLIDFMLHDPSIDKSVIVNSKFSYFK
jgi:hypothetical protein